MQTKPFCAGLLAKAKVLVVGHDPRLQQSNTQAEYAFFADYYFKPIPTHKSELKKYRLAEAVYNYICYLTSHSYTANELVLTNLCNAGLPHAPKGKIVLIPEVEARTGINAIQYILSESSVEVVFAMSAQVNYWLQKLEFYSPVPEFLDSAEPRPNGIIHIPPYYEPKRNRSFQLVCGQSYTNGRWRLFPVLHVKNWPLRGNFIEAYGKAYEKCINELKRNIG